MKARAAEKAERNKRLRDRGYRWMLQAPDGRIMTIQQAERELDAIEVEEDRTFWDEVPPDAGL